MIRPIFLSVLFVTLVLSVRCHAGYTIHVDGQRQEYTTVNGPAGPQQWPASKELVNPPTYGAELCRPDTYSVFAAESSRRTRVFHDSLGGATSADILAACPQFKGPLAARIRAEGARRLEALTPYSAAERDTWPQQQREAEEYGSNPDCACPMIRQIATVRGITVPVLVGKIMENIALYPAAAGAILGQQQKLLDQIEAETDIDKLLAITWP